MLHLHWMSDGEFSIMFYNIVNKIKKYILIILIIVFGFSLAFMVQHHCLILPSNATVRYFYSFPKYDYSISGGFLNQRGEFHEGLCNEPWGV